MEAADILGALQARVALVPGCRDLEERPLLLVPVPAENAPWTKERLDLVLRYFASIFRWDSAAIGMPQGVAGVAGLLGPAGEHLVPVGQPAASHGYA